jgi:nicotinamide-nucleotide adenylyltransferase
MDDSFVVLGRFQPFHKGHAAMIKSAEVYRSENYPNLNLVIAIGSSNRPQTLQNPWSYNERAEMISSWLRNEENIDAIIVSIPDIDDPPNWVSHAEAYHGHSGVFFSSDDYSCKLYQDSGWITVSTPLVDRSRFEGWRVRETARMLSTINDEEAIRMVLGESIPESVVEYLISNDSLKRLAFLGEGGEPVG